MEARLADYTRKERVEIYQNLLQEEEAIQKSYQECKSKSPLEKLIAAEQFEQFKQRMLERIQQALEISITNDLI